MTDFKPQILEPKDVSLEAVRFSGGVGQANAIIDWVKENGGAAKYLFERIELQVSRDENTLVSRGDWVVKLPDGSFERWKHARVAFGYRVVYPS